MKKILTQNWVLVILLALSLLTIFPLLSPGYFSHHDDLQVIRILQMRVCMEDFQIPCRWVPDMGYGYGFPLFNYYAPLAYYVGAPLSYLFGFIGSAKLIFLLPVIIGVISMYLLGRELTNRWGGFIASSLYLFAPYKAVDLYVRGAVAELFALGLIPLVFYFVIKALKEGKTTNFIGLSLTLAAFLLSHNIMTMLFAPFIILWFAIYLYKTNFKFVKGAALALVLGFGLASFFIIPAYMEKPLVQTERLTMTDLDFRAHFVTVNQLFIDRDWGYGASQWGPDDDMSFQVGLPLWPLAGLIILLSLIKTKSRSWRKRHSVVAVFLVFMFMFSLLMTHNKSAFIWEKIDILWYTQFPWRFLSLVIFTGSLLVGYLAVIVKDKYLKYLAAFILATTLIFNIGYFRPEDPFIITDEEKLSGGYWEEQIKGAIEDYLPVGAVKPQEIAPEKPIVLEGDTNILEYSKTSKNWSLLAEVTTESTVEIPIFDFPGWRVESNGVTTNHEQNEGKILLKLTEGTHEIRGGFKNTPVRSFSNIITMISIIGLVILQRRGKN